MRGAGMGDKEQNPDEFAIDIGDIQAKMSELDNFSEHQAASEVSDTQNQQNEDLGAEFDISKDAKERSEQASPSINMEAFLSLLSDIGTGLWRMQKTMVDRETGEPSEEMRRPYRHLRVLLDSLQDRGVEIHDHTGERVPDSGVYGLKVITYEPKEELQNEIVTETLKPTIILDNRIVQMGEVIVGIPKSSEDDGEED
jgi:hypothetical protein